MKIQELTQELVDLVKKSVDLTDTTFSVFDIEDLETISGHVGFPIAGVSYEGAFPVENSVNPTSRQHKGVVFTTHTFMVTIGVNYRYASSEDTKPIATDLLDATRSVIVGHQGVNTRPWRFAGELPQETVLEGVIFYGQLWETDLPVIGNSPT